MDTREIQKLIDFISKSDLNEVNIETAELKLNIKRNSNNPVQYLSQPTYELQPSSQPKIEIAQEASTTNPSQESVSAQVNSKLIEVKSPMIGTYYRAAGPDKPNFAEVGDEITTGQVICIIEAMKLFNEIESEISGKIVKILVNDASPVEFDQPLFLIDPS